MRAPPESLRPMTGAPFFDRQIHDLADLRGVGFRERAAEDREVLGEEIDQAAVDRAVAAHHAVAGDLLVLHAEIAAAVGDQCVDFDERPGVEEQVDPFAGGELAVLVLAVHALRPAPGGRGREASLEIGQQLVAHESPSVCPQGA